MYTVQCTVHSVQRTACNTVQYLWCCSVYDPCNDFVHFVECGHLAAEAADLQLSEQHLEAEHLEALHPLLQPGHQRGKVLQALHDRRDRVVLRLVLGPLLQLLVGEILEEVGHGLDDGHEEGLGGAECCWA